MSVVNITPGSIVMACAGRDKDSFFVALESHDGLVFLANGKERKLEKPKKKNIRHISPTDTVISLDGLTNKKLRRLIAEYEPDTTHKADCMP